jgi:hypothetical protein
VDSAPRARDRDIIEDSPTGLQPITEEVSYVSLALFVKTNYAKATMLHSVKFFLTPISGEPIGFRGSASANRMRAVVLTRARTLRARTQ